MTRYQIVYGKTDNVLVTWSDTPDNAHALAEKLRATGYGVDVWAQDRDRIQKTDL